MTAAAAATAPGPSAVHGVVGRTSDQAVEHASAAASPWTWPRSEPVIDVGHDGVDAPATGVVADRPAATSRR